MRRGQGGRTSTTSVGRSAVASAARSIAEDRTSLRNSAGAVSTSRSAASLLRIRGWVERVDGGQRRGSRLPVSSRSPASVRGRRIESAQGKGPVSHPTRSDWRVNDFGPRFFGIDPALESSWFKTAARIRSVGCGHEEPTRRPANRIVPCRTTEHKFDTRDLPHAPGASRCGRYDSPPSP